MNQPSTTSTLQWNIVGWYSAISTPASSSGPQSAREAARTTSESMIGPGTTMRTFTPRFGRLDQGADRQRRRGRNSCSTRSMLVFADGDGEQVHQVHALGAAARRAAEHLRRHAARHRLHRREVDAAVQHPAGRLGPVVVEHRLHLRHHRAAHPEMGVAPVLGVLGVAAPLVGDADAAGVAHPAVDHQDLAVRPVVEPRQVRPVRLVIALDLDAGALHPLERGLVEPGAADPVEQHVHLDAVPGAVREGVGELVADRAVPVDVRLEADRRLRAADVFEHRLEDPVAVDQHLGGIALDERRAEQEREVAGEGRIAGVVQPLERPVDLLLGGAEVGDDQRDDDAEGEGDAEPEEEPPAHAATRHPSGHSTAPECVTAPRCAGPTSFAYFSSTPPARSPARGRHAPAAARASSRRRRGHLEHARARRRCGCGRRRAPARSARRAPPRGRCSRPSGRASRPRSARR